MKLIRKNTLHHVYIYRFALYNELKKKKKSDGSLRAHFCARCFRASVGGSEQLRLDTAVSLALVIKKERQENDTNGFG